MHNLESINQLVIIRTILCRNWGSNLSIKICEPQLLDWKKVWYPTIKRFVANLLCHFFGEVSQRLKSKGQTNMEQKFIFYFMCACVWLC